MAVHRVTLQLEAQGFCVSQAGQAGSDVFPVGDSVEGQQVEVIGGGDILTGKIPDAQVIVQVGFRQQVAVGS